MPVLVLLQRPNSNDRPVLTQAATVLAIRKVGFLHLLDVQVLGFRRSPGHLDLKVPQTTQRQT